MPENETIVRLTRPTRRLLTFGTHQLCEDDGNGVTIVFRPGKPLALITYLSTLPKRAAHRTHLLDLLWSDRRIGGAGALRQTLWLIRRRLGPDAVSTRLGYVTLGASFDTDRDEFLSAVAREDFHQAVDLYGGPFLPDFAAPGGVEFEQWSEVERIRLQQVFVRMAEAAIHDLLSRGRSKEAQQLAQRVRDKAPDAEPLRRIGIEAFLLSGDAIRAELAADDLERWLQERDLAPRPATRALIERVRASTRHTRKDHREDAAPALRAELTGREAPFATLLKAWRVVERSGSRHCHVTADPGIGKTRLIEEVERRLSAEAGLTASISASIGDQQIDYALVSELAAALAVMPGAAGIPAQVAGDLIELHPPLASRFPSVPDVKPRNTEFLRRRIAAIIELLDAVADNRPVAVFVDDVHWADPPSLQILQYIITKLPPSVLVVTAARRTIPETFGTVTSVSLVLEPLDADAVFSFVSSLAALPEAPWVSSFVARLVHATRGSPLDILETLRLCLDNGVLDMTEGAWSCPDARGMAPLLAEGAALRHRLTALGPEDGRVLILLAVSGAPLPTRRIGELSKRDEASTQHRLDRLEARGLVVSASQAWRLSHDEVGRVAMALADPAEITAAHRNIGLMVAERADNDPRELARSVRHLVGAQEDAHAKRVFSRWAHLQRTHRDRRTATQLAVDCLADVAAAGTMTAFAASLPWRIRFPGFDRAVVASLLAVIAVVVGFVLAIRPVRPPDAYLVTMSLERLEGTPAAIQVPVRRDQWDADRAPINLLAESDPALRLPSDWIYQYARRSPGGSRWAVARVAPDSGGLDLFLVEGSNRSRLTNTPGDDTAPAWSPDGRSLVFVTARWHDMSWYDLAILDVETRAVRRFVTGELVYDVPSWSPDGTRILYIRKPHGSSASEWCIRSVDGTPGPCRSDGERVIGWSGPQHVLAFRTGAGATTFVRINTDTGESADIGSWPHEVTTCTGSNDGVWISCRRVDGNLTRFITHTDLIQKPVALSASARTDLVFDLSVAQPNFLREITLVPPERPVPIGIPFRLRATGRSNHGTAMRPQALRWAVASGSNASIDDDGWFIGRERGAIDVTVTAGGWRTAGARIDLGAAREHPIHREAWDEGWPTRWGTYGDPDRPDVVAGPGGLPALWTRGDDSFLSGAYYRPSLDPTDGIGVELLMSAPVTMRQWQSTIVLLAPWWDQARVDAWDHRIGTVPGHTDYANTTCGTQIPLFRRDEPPALSLYPERGRGRVPMNPDLLTGDWQRVRIQLFPDGTCGIAINGTAILRGVTALPLDSEYQLVIEGASFDTRILVGPLRIWEGVQTDIDWSHARTSR